MPRKTFTFQVNDEGKFTFDPPGDWNYRRGDIIRFRSPRFRSPAISCTRAAWNSVSSLSPATSKAFWMCVIACSRFPRRIRLSAM